MRSKKWLRARAKELYGLGSEIDVDSDARVSYGDEQGAFVQAWVWVPFAEPSDPETMTWVQFEEQSDSTTPWP